MNGNNSLITKITDALRNNGCTIKDDMNQSGDYASFTYRFSNLDIECSLKHDTFLSMIVRMPLGQVCKEFVARACGELTFNCFLTKVTFRANEGGNELEVAVDTYVDPGVNYQNMTKTLNDALIRAIVNFEELYNAQVRDVPSG